MAKRILIIDDEENIRRMMRLALEAAGYEAGEAADGEQGLELYREGSAWEAVLLDERMPGLDGLETLTRLKQRNREARVIMVTAYASIELAVTALKAGATDFVRKPTTPEILRGALQAALAKPGRKGAPAAIDSSKLSQPQIQTMTLNGFEIIRPTTPATIPARADEHGFIVKSPQGHASQVIVKIDEAALAYVERMNGRRLPAANSFWLYRAERFLGDYLWNLGEVPASGRLTLRDLDRNELLIAERWEGE